MNDSGYQIKLKKLFSKSTEIQANTEDRFVIFSDLHFGDGGRKDDFKHNAELFKFVIKANYIPKKYNLILNGDIEDLYKFDIHKIYKKYKDIYDLFEIFNSKNQFFKLIGNHDYTLLTLKYPSINKRIYQSLKLNFNNNTIFVYHGHQVSNYIDDFNYLSYFLIRFLISPLNIKNSVISINNSKKFKTEIRAYKFSAFQKIISIIGHTHRPLFESLSRIDTLNMRIEQIMRKINKLNDEDKSRYLKLLNDYKTQLLNLYQKNGQYNLRNGIYNEQLLIPCLFNSGSGIGKRGITCIEIRKDKIALVYWFDKNRSDRYLNDEDIKSKQLNDSNYYKAIIKSEPLSYIFNRINLLAD